MGHGVRVVSIYLSIQVGARQGCCYYRIYISSYTTHCGAQIDQITRELQLLQIYHTSQWQRHGARHSHASSHNFHIVAGNILTFVFVLRSYQSYVSSVWHWRSRINYCLLIIFLFFWSSVQCQKLRPLLIVIMWSLPLIETFREICLFSMFWSHTKEKNLWWEKLSNDKCKYLNLRKL